MAVDTTNVNNEQTPPRWRAIADYLVNTDTAQFNALDANEKVFWQYVYDNVPPSTFGTPDLTLGIVSKAVGTNVVVGFDTPDQDAPYTAFYTLSDIVAYTNAVTNVPTNATTAASNGANKFFTIANAGFTAGKHVKVGVRAHDAEGSAATKGPLSILDVIYAPAAPASIAAANGVGSTLVTWAGPTQPYQECGLTGKAGATETGLATTTQYYFKVAYNGGTPIEYSITTAATTTYTAVLALLNAATPLVEWSLQAGDLRATSKASVGVGATIALSAGTTGTNLFVTLTGFTAFDTAVAGTNTLGDETYDLYYLDDAVGTENAATIISTGVRVPNLPLVSRLGYTISDLTVGTCMVTVTASNPGGTSLGGTADAATIS